jgi:hypothetical protein
MNVRITKTIALAMFFLNSSFSWTMMNNEPRIIKEQNEDYIMARDFFQDIVGMDEATFRKQYSWNTNTGKLDTFKLDQKDAWIKAYPRRAAIWQGNFEFLTNGDLDKKLEQKKFPAQSKGSFKILIHNPNKPELTDVRYLIEQPGNYNAVFQVASTFWGPLEGGMARHEALISNMFPAAAQGEIISVCTAAATIYRKYFMEKIFYLLENLLGAASYKTGKYGQYIPKGYIQDFRYAWNQENYDTKQQANDIAKVGLGVHSNIVASLGQTNRPFKKPDGNELQKRLSIDLNADRITVNINKTQIVNLIFSSAYNLRDSKIFPDNDLNQRWLINFCTMILKGSYLGTLKSAAYLGKTKVYLTLMGASAFRNKMAWLADAMNNSEFKDIIKKAGLEVILVYRPEPGKTWRNKEEDIGFLKQMFSIADNINGTTLAKNTILENNLNIYLDNVYAKPDPINPTPELMENIKSIIEATAPVQPVTPVTPVVTPQQQQLGVLTQSLQNLTNELKKLKDTLGKMK